MEESLKTGTGEGGFAAISGGNGDFFTKELGFLHSFLTFDQSI